MRQHRTVARYLGGKQLAIVPILIGITYTKTKHSSDVDLLIGLLVSQSGSVVFDS